jgi:hypothetical protein
MAMTGAIASGPPLPILGSDVSLVIPDREMLRARVDEVVPGGVELAILQAALTPNHRSTSYIEFVGDYGLWRYIGHFTPLDRAPYTDPAGVRQVVLFTYAGPPQLMQRREFIRAAHVCRLALFDLGDPDAVAETGFTVNVSGGGMLVRGFRSLAVGDELRAELMLEPGGPRLVATCRVVHGTPDGRHGVQFTSIGDVDRDRLVEFAYAIERARREMAFSR